MNNIIDHGVIATNI